MLRLVALSLAAVGALGEHMFEYKGGAKPCDIYVDDEGLEMCGPAIVIIGAGKCGTNKLASHLRQFDNIKHTAESEVYFDPYWIEASQTVRKHNPGVRPDDPYVWMIKWLSLFREPDIEAVLGRIHKAWPSAVVYMSICDQILLDYRWFRHNLRPWEGLIGEVDGYLKANFNRSALDLYVEARPVADSCYPPKGLMDILNKVVDDGGPSRREDQKGGIKEIAKRFWPGTLGSSCIEASLYGTWLYRMLLAAQKSPYYTLGENFAVVVMENWLDETQATDNIKRIAEVLPMHTDNKALPQSNLAAKEFSIPTELERVFPAQPAYDLLRQKLPATYWATTAAVNCKILKLADATAPAWYTESFC